MKVAALLVLLVVPPGRAAEDVTPAQARANVVRALPPDIAEGAGIGDLRAYLERLSPAQKQAALRSLTQKEGELGDDPATLGVIGQAYAGLGKVKEARVTAHQALRRNPQDPEAKRLLAWVASQEKLQGRDAGAGPADARRPGGGYSPAADGRRTGLNALEQRIERAFRRGQRSAEFQDTMRDARGLSVNDLKAAGIIFKPAEPDQRDAVLITRQGEGFAVSLRADALNSGGDAEARAAAHVANGVRQAQTLRDHEVIGWALIKARGWISGARTHKELAPGDIEARPVSKSDANLMVARKLLDRDSYSYDTSTEKFSADPGEVLGIRMMQSKALDKDPQTRLDLEGLFAYFMKSTQRAGAN